MAEQKRRASRTQRRNALAVEISRVPPKTINPEQLAGGFAAALQRLPNQRIETTLSAVFERMMMSPLKCQPLRSGAQFPGKNVDVAIFTLL